MRGLLSVLPLVLPLALAPAAGEHEAGAATITVDDVETHLVALASAPLEGRDTPSVGLSRAQDYVIERFRAAGLEGAAADGGFRLPWSRELPAPKAAACRLEIRGAGTGGEALELGVDFVPVPGCGGRAEGAAVFCGFGIAAKKERYDDLKGVDLEGKVAVILEGEPRHARRFEGEVVTPDADLFVKLASLERAGASAVVVVRRPPEAAPEGAAPAGLGFRHTWATWNPSSGQREPQVPREIALPCVEVTPAAASRLLGIDVLAKAAEIDASCRPDSGHEGPAPVVVASATETRAVAADNVVGVLKGSDPELADEYVVVGAHVDHVGVDRRGQIGFGADDNASGTSALIEVVEALTAARPRRSILACAFSGEEDGLLGSRELAKSPPVPKEALVAMLNLDMIGRGDEREVVVLGTDQCPDLEAVLKRAAKLGGPKVKPITGKARHLWERSDHHPFHEQGVPVLFFFESESELDNPDYHTWRDTIDLVNTEKVARTARLCFNATWILAEDDARPSPPGG